MKNTTYDFLIVGAGVVGSMIARWLSRYQTNILLIDKEVDLGMGATLLNRVVIGKNCLIGANSLIPEGRVIPDRSLVVGSPGRIVRELSDEEVDNLQKSADRYAENWQRFARELKLIG